MFFRFIRMAFPPNFHDGGKKRYVVYKNDEGDLVCNKLYCRQLLPTDFIGFSLVKSGDQSIHDNAEVTITNWSVFEDLISPELSSAIDLTAGVFTCPEDFAGLYELHVEVELTPDQDGGRYLRVLRDYGTDDIEVITADNIAGSIGSHLQAHTLMYLEPGETIRIRILIVSANNSIDVLANTLFGKTRWIMRRL